MGSVSTVNGVRHVYRVDPHKTMRKYALKRNVVCFP